MSLNIKNSTNTKSLPATSKIILNRLFRIFFLMLILGVVPNMATGAVIEVDSDMGAGVVEINGADGFCSLIEAIINANDNVQTHTDCDAGDDLTDGGDTVLLDGNTFTLTAVNNGRNGLPEISTKVNIEGNGSIIERMTGAPQFRILYINFGNLTLNKVTIRGGRPLAADGGGIFNFSGTLTLNNSNVSDNDSEEDGGGIFNFGTLTINNSNVSNNDSDADGGGIYNFSGTLTINNSTISGNTSREIGGGGISNVATLTINSSTISGNTSKEYFGGGILNEGTTTINNSTITGNMAGLDSILTGFLGGGGGGIANTSILTINNSTISGNMAGTDGLRGGGILNIGSISEDTPAGTITISNSTVSNNTPGGIYNRGGFGTNFPGSQLIMGNTLIGNNAAADCILFTETTAGNPPMPIVGGLPATITDNGDNLIEDTGSGACSLANGTNGNIIGVNPNIGLLQDNGGPTFTHALLTGSQAIDNGNNTICADTNTIDGLDQRLFSRNDGNCDIGAYEAQTTTTAKLTKITQPSGGTGFDFEITRMTDETVVLTNFKLDDTEMHTTIIPTGDIAITEDIPEGYELIIDCSSTTTSNAPLINNTLGTVDVTILSSDEVVDCTFTNTLVITCDIDVTVSGDGEGTVTGDGINCDETNGPTCSIQVELGSSVDFDAATDPGSIFNGFSGDCDTGGVIDPVGDLSGDDTISSCTDTCTAEFLLDDDGDGEPNITDGCPNDPDKSEPGECGCGVADTDTDGDGTADCNDMCVDDPNKTEPGECGCGETDTDTDGDGTEDCNDNCPDDINKTEPGQCGCGAADTDTDGDGTADCNDMCIDDPDKSEPGVCGCGVTDTDTDSDGTEDCNDNCPDDINKTEPGECGCGVPEGCNDMTGDDDDDDANNDDTIDDTEPNSPPGVETEGGGTVIEIINQDDNNPLGPVTININLPDGILPQSAVGNPPGTGTTCSIFNTQNNRIAEEDVDISCEVENIDEEFELFLGLCNDGSDELVAEAIVEIISPDLQEVNEDFIEIIVNQLNACQLILDSGDNNDGSDESCTLAPSGSKPSASGLLLLIPALVGIGSMFLRRRKK